MAKLFGSDDVNVPVYILVILFGAGSWVAVNGLWVELPLLVQDLPEGWNLPSFLVIIIQTANIAPIIYTLVRKCCKNVVNERRCVYVLVLIGCTACLLLAFLWQRTLSIAGKEHSVVLFILAFLLATVDCTSSVVFLPFIGKLKPQYLTAFFIGEGLSGLLPSLVALAQGASDNKCVNKTIVNSTTGKNSTILVPVIEHPNFSVGVFFFFLFCMMFVCGFSFILLNYLPMCRREHVKTPTQGSPSSSSDDMEQKKVFYRQVRPHDEEEYRSGEVTVEDCSSSQVPLQSPERKLSTCIYVSLLLLTLWVNAMGNGILPSVQSYSALPYGRTAYHLAVTLSSIANPLTCFVLFVVPCRSKKLAAWLTMAGTAIMAYIVFLALSSPAPPLVGQVTGQMMMVTVWILTTAILSCVKVVVASILRHHCDRSALLWYGVVEQVGSAMGALLSFTAVNVLHLFTAKDPCT